MQFDFNINTRLSLSIQCTTKPLQYNGKRASAQKVFPLEKWNEDDVYKALTSLGESYIPVAERFRMDGIDGNMLRDFTEADLFEMGFHLTRVQIKKLLKGLDTVRGTTTALTTS